MWQVAAFAAAEGLGLAGQFASGILSARARRAEFDEQIRRLALKRDMTVGLATARAAASGVMVDAGTSTSDYLSQLTGEFNMEIGAMRSAAKRAYSSNLIAAVAGAVGGAGDIFGKVGTMEGWWK